MHRATRLKTLAALAFAGGALAALAPPSAAADVTVVATPPNPVVGTPPNPIVFEPGLILVVQTTATDTRTLVNVEIQPGPPD